MNIRCILKLFFAFVLIGAGSSFASNQILDPEIYQSELDYIRIQDPFQIHHPSQQSITQTEWNNYIPQLNFSSEDSDFFLRMTKNTYETPHFVFNAHLKNFFNLHNSRPLSYLELDAKTDPFYSQTNNIYAPHSFGGMAGQFYAECFDFFSFDIKPYFLFHDDTGVGHATLKEAYGSIHINKLSIDIGKARLHWGYGAYQPMVFGDDAEPFFMVRLRNNEEFKFDGMLSFLGKIKFEIFYGWLDQFRTYPDGNIIGSTFSIQPTDRLNLHADQTVLFGGSGSPTNNPLVFFNETFVKSPKNPANRNLMLGARYRIPHLEIEPYADIYVEDCCGSSPINPRNMLNLVGIYVPPKDAGKKFDLAVEWVRTNYITYRHDAFIYTQSRKILGHPIGPDASGLYTVARYFHSKQLQFESMFAYETRGRKGQALSNLGFVDIRTIEPTFEAAEKRFRVEQFVNFFVTPFWKWTIHAGAERINELNYQLGNNRWQGMFGVESAFNF